MITAPIHVFWVHAYTAVESVEAMRRILPILTANLAVVGAIILTVVILALMLEKCGGAQ